MGSCVANYCGTKDDLIPMYDRQLEIYSSQKNLNDISSDETNTNIPQSSLSQKPKTQKKSQQQQDPENLNLQQNRGSQGDSFGSNINSEQISPPLSQRETIQTATISPNKLRSNESIEKQPKMSKINLENDNNNSNSNDNDNNDTINETPKRSKEKYKQTIIEVKKSYDQPCLTEPNQNNVSSFVMSPIMEEGSQISSAINNTPRDMSASSLDTQVMNSKVQHNMQIVKYSEKRREYPQVRLESGHVYEGEWCKCQQDGYGITYYQDYTKYEGQYTEGKANGEGILTFPDGDFYIGQFKNDQQHGMGRYVQQDSEYHGQWENGQQHGRGKEIWGDKKQNSYVGMYCYGKRHGKGKLVLDELTYQGDFVNGCMQGTGIIQFSDSRTYEGEMFNNRMHGKGKMTYNHGHENYQGTFVNDLMEGEGTYVFQNKAKYVGQWLQNKMHGNGMIVFPDKKRIRGVWENGKCKMQEIETQSLCDQSSYERSTIIQNGRSSKKFTERKSYLKIQQSTQQNQQQYRLSEFHPSESSFTNEQNQIQINNHKNNNINSNNNNNNNEQKNYINTDIDYSCGDFHSTRVNKNDKVQVSSFRNDLLQKNQINLTTQENDGL